METPATNQPVIAPAKGSSMSDFDRWFGGSPLSVLFRLVLLSVLVGVILSALGLDPFNILNSIERLVRAVWDMGFDAIAWLWRYFLLGAVIVIPIWLIVRLARGVGNRA
jgi:hypothetical protein